MSALRDRYEDSPPGLLRYVAAARGWPPSVAYAKALAFAEVEVPSWTGFGKKPRTSTFMEFADLVEDIPEPGSNRLAFAIRERARALADNDYDVAAQAKQLGESVATDVRRGAAIAVRGTQMLGPIFLAVAILYAFGRK